MRILSLFRKTQEWMSKESVDYRKTLRNKILSMEMRIKH